MDLALVDLQAHPGLESLIVELNIVDPPHHHAGAFDRGPDLEAADIFEVGVDLVAVGQVDAAGVPHLEPQYQQSNYTRGDEYPDPKVHYAAFHECYTPLNMKAVRMKSKARIARDDVTTVRVVAPETPSAVGGAS